MTRRFRRIFPPYWICLGFFILFVAVTDYVLFPEFLSGPGPRPVLRPWWFSPSQWLGNLTLTETWRPHLFGSQRGLYLGHAWTLCYEEQFYLVMGFFMLFSPFRFYLAATMTTLITMLVGIANQYWELPINGFFFDGAWLLFAAGILVYHWVNHATGWIRTLDVILLGSFILYSLTVNLEFNSITVGLGFAGLLMSLHRWDRQIADSIWLRPISWCGVICYSLYLMHPILVKTVMKAGFDFGLSDSRSTLLIMLPMSLAVSLVSGWIFFLTVERRFLNRPQTSHVTKPVHSTATLAGANSSITG